MLEMEIQTEYNKDKEVTGMTQRVKSARLQIRVTPELDEKLRRIAEERGLTVSHLVGLYIAQGLQQEDQKQKFMDEFTEMLKKPENFSRVMEAIQGTLDV